MILTFTLDPAVRVSYLAGRLARGTANPVARISQEADGGGLPVAKVLAALGHDVVAGGIAGGLGGQIIGTDLARHGVRPSFTASAGEPRRVLQITDSGAGDTTTLCEPARYITTEELGRLAADYRALVREAAVVVLSGTVPAGLPPEIYASLVSYAADAGVPAILDTAGPPLRHALPRHPALVIPGNPDDHQVLLAAGAQAAGVLSACDVLAASPAGQWRARLAGHPGLPVSRPGLVAGFLPVLADGWSWPDTLRHAVALGVATGDTGIVDLDAYESLLAEVAVEPPE